MVDPGTFIETVRDENQTELSRLGSSKGLYAETGGNIDTDPVLQATARAEHAAWQTFDGWAADEGDEDARELFQHVAEQERAHYETVTDRLDDAVEHPDDVPALHEYLRGCEGTLDRLGAFVGRVLASKRSKEQVVGFFVGHADPQSADVFRDFGTELDDQLERATALLAEHIEDEAAWEQALAAASGAIEAAYDEYVAHLEALGANPKPVC